MAPIIPGLLVSDATGSAHTPWTLPRLPTGSTQPLGPSPSGRTSASYPGCHARKDVSLRSPRTESTDMHTRLLRLCKVLFSRQINRGAAERTQRRDQARDGAGITRAVWTRSSLRKLGKYPTPALSMIMIRPPYLSQPCQFLLSGLVGSPSRHHTYFCTCTCG